VTQLENVEAPLPVNERLTPVEENGLDHPVV
jgi:hypothetical protein